MTLTVAGAGGPERTVGVTLGSTPDEAATTSEPGSRQFGDPFGNQPGSPFRR